MTVDAHQDTICALAYSNDAKTIASASINGYARLWDVVTGQLKLSLPKSQVSYSSISFCPAGKYLATHSYDGTLRLWNATTGGLKNTVSIHEKINHFSHFAFSLDSRYILLKMEGRHAVWDIRAARIVGDDFDYRVPGGLQILSQGSQVVTHFQNNSQIVKVGNAETKFACLINAFSELRCGRKAVISPNGKLIANEMPDGQSRFMIFPQVSLSQHCGKARHTKSSTASSLLRLSHFLQTLS